VFGPHTDPGLDALSWPARLLAPRSGYLINSDGTIQGIILLAIRDGLPIGFVQNVDVVDAVAGCDGADGFELEGIAVEGEGDAAAADFSGFAKAKIGARRKRENETAVMREVEPWEGTAHVVERAGAARGLYPSVQCRLWFEDLEIGVCGEEIARVPGRSGDTWNVHRVRQNDVDVVDQLVTGGWIGEETGSDPGVRAPMTLRLQSRPDQAPDSAPARRDGKKPTARQSKSDGAKDADYTE
jgi:hypothetical protein